jgi:2-haloacid dehalogenase
MPVRAVVFDVGNVLYHWRPRALYERLIADDRALDAFLAEVVTPDWHFQHDAGRPFAETSAELIAEHPHHRELIEAWGANFEDSITGPVDGMHDLVAELDEGGVPIFGITNFSEEFWLPFRKREAALFDRFRDIVVSGTEKLVKPDPAIYALALKRFGLAPGEGLFIDDSLANVEGARTNGFVAHHFANSRALRVSLMRYHLLPAEVDDGNVFSVGSKRQD